MNSPIKNLLIERILAKGDMDEGTALFLDKVGFNEQTARQMSDWDLDGLYRAAHPAISRRVSGCLACLAAYPLTPHLERMIQEMWKGDCLELMNDIPDGSVDAIITDPPYGTTSCKWDSVIPFAPMWEQLNRVIKPNGAIVLTASQPFTSALGASNLPMLKYSWYWQKTRATGHLNAKKMPMKDIEDVLVFYQSLPTYNPQGLYFLGKTQSNSASDMARGITSSPTSTVTGGITKKTYTQTNTNYPRQVLEFPSEGSTTHPTQKPVALWEYLIKTYTNEGELVLDFTAGSFTTMEACENLNRQYICIEQEQKYFDIGVERRERVRTANAQKAAQLTLL